MPNTDWEIPPNLQPLPGDYRFDLGQVLENVVGLRANISPEAFTASALGTERAGSGAVLPDGLVLTMAYLITEAETIWLTTHDGRAVQGHMLAADYDTGLGLVQPLGRLRLSGLEFGNCDVLEPGSRVLLAASGGRQRAIETQIVGRQEFAGYWEYLIEDALFTSPAHPSWGGAALIGGDGGLLGIGSLILQQGDGRGRRVDMNMVVPITQFLPVRQELLHHGGLARPARPWLGLYAMESDGAVMVGGVADGGPADRAGVRVGDRVVQVAGEEVSDLAGLWRKLWSLGTAGTKVALRLGRDDELISVTIESADRAAFLRSPRLH